MRKKSFTECVHDALHGKVQRIVRSVWIPRKQFRDKRGRFTNKVRRGYLRVLEREKKWTPIRKLMIDDISKNNAFLKRLRDLGRIK